MAACDIVLGHLLPQGPSRDLGDEFARKFAAFVWRLSVDSDTP